MCESGKEKWYEVNRSGRGHSITMTYVIFWCLIALSPARGPKNDIWRSWLRGICFYPRVLLFVNMSECDWCFRTITVVHEFSLQQWISRVRFQFLFENNLSETRLDSLAGLTEGLWGQTSGFMVEPRSALEACWIVHRATWGFLDEKIPWTLLEAPSYVGAS